MFFRIVCESTHQSTTSSSSRGGAGGRNYPWPLCNHCPFHSRMVAETGVVTRAGERSSGLTLGSPARTNLFCPRPLRPFHSLEVPAGRCIAEEESLDRKTDGVFCPRLLGQNRSVTASQLAGLIPMLAYARPRSSNSPRTGRRACQTWVPRRLS